MDGVREKHTTSFWRKVADLNDYLTVLATALSVLSVIVSIFVAFIAYRSYVNDRDLKVEDFLDKAWLLIRDPSAAQLGLSYTKDFSDLDKASRLIRNALRLDSDNPRALLYQALVYMGLNDTSEAKEWFARAVKEGPHMADTHLHYGVFLMQQDEAGSAVQHLVTAKKLAATRASEVAATINLGLALLAKNDFEGAKEQLLRATRKAPDVAETHQALGRYYQRRQLHDKAVESFRRAVEVAPDSADLRIQLVQSLVLLGSYDEAVLALREAEEELGDGRFLTLRRNLSSIDSRFSGDQKEGAKPM